MAEIKVAHSCLFPSLQVKPNSSSRCMNEAGADDPGHDAQRNDGVQPRHIHDNGGQQYRDEHLPVEPPAQVYFFHLDTSFGTKPNSSRSRSRSKKLSSPFMRRLLRSGSVWVTCSV